MPGHRTAALQRLISEDAVGQLRRREGLMARLGSEDGALKLDWVEGAARLLDDSTKLEEVEAEARGIWEHGIRHIIWAGMGGSIISVRVLAELGFCGGQDDNFITIYPLDSTDPAALNDIVRRLADIKHLTLPQSEVPPDSSLLQALLNNVMMIGVSMGMTSEEPITHLTWFTELLAQAQLQPPEHLLVMTLPGSYLDAFAHEHQVPSRPLQLDGGTDIGGRMSAPTTRVFLLPAALYLTRLSNESGLLRRVLHQAWQQHNLAITTEHPANSAFVRLAAALSNASSDGACRLFLKMPQGWQAIVQWIEQLMEESLGKGGKGVVVFDEQMLNDQAPSYSMNGTLPVHVITDLAQSEENNIFHLYQPYLASKEPQNRLAAVATSFLGWQLSMALYGYLHTIMFAGQPAVENYKTRARALRTQQDPLEVISNWEATVTDGSLTLLAPQKVETQGSPASVFAKALQQAVSAPDKRVRLSFLDFTINGNPSTSLLSVINAHMHKIGNEFLGVPIKLRQAPAAYHSTEQSEMDGSPHLVSLRLLMHDHEKSILGTYTDTFLCAQAVSTWQAMIEQERPCFLLIVNGVINEVIEPLNSFLENVQRELS